MNILITGGASGLGEAITRTLAKDINNKVYFTYSKSDVNARKIEGEFANTVAVKCDFLDANSLSGLIGMISKIELDVLVNNAFWGTPVKTYFHKIVVDEFSADFNNYILPTVQITQAAIGYFRKKKKGKVITILTSFLLNTPPMGSSVYVANKAYLQSLVKSWATENSHFGISSNSVSPSFMLTNLTAEVDERLIEQMKENHPLKQLLTTEEAANAVLFLTNASPQINGIDILLNAGVNIK
jgi:NAD(P)-dependent dehydrogenase (short-subunit alcohol dehydrogenase family)